MNDTPFCLDPARGVVCSRAGHFVAEQTNSIPACLHCGKGFCPECMREGVRLSVCPLGRTDCTF